MKRDKTVSEDAIPPAPRPWLPWLHPTMLAPMEGFTGPALRGLMARRGGLGVVCTEFVRITRHPPGRPILARVVRKPPGLPLSVQVMGRDARALAETGARLEEAGADIVDLNLGCPTRRAARGGVGASLLEDPDALARVLDAMRAGIRVPLSAKIRAGLDPAGRALDLARRIEGAGFDFLVIHPRRRREALRGVADWRVIRLVARGVRIPVVGNGDCWYAADALRMERETGCAAVMIGRPALRNPWIFEQIAGLRAGRPPRRPCGRDLFEHLAAYVDLLRPLARDAPEGLLARTKEMLHFLSRSFPGGAEFLRAALRLASLGELMRFVEERLAPMPAAELDLDALGTRRRERSGSACRERTPPETPSPPGPR